MNRSPLIIYIISMGLTVCLAAKWVNCGSFERLPFINYLQLQSKWVDLRHKRRSYTNVKCPNFVLMECRRFCKVKESRRTAKWNRTIIRTTENVENFVNEFQPNSIQKPGGFLQVNSEQNPAFLVSCFISFFTHIFIVRHFKLFLRMNLNSVK